MKTEFNSKVKEIQVYITQRNVEKAKVALDEAWELTDNVKSLRKIAHALGNEIQGVIFEQYLKFNPKG